MREAAQSYQALKGGSKVLRWENHLTFGVHLRVIDEYFLIRRVAPPRW